MAISNNMFSADPAYVSLSNGNRSCRSSHEQDRHPAFEGKPLLPERLILWHQVTVVFAIAFIFGAMSSKLITFAARSFSSENENKLKQLVDCMLAVFPRCENHNGWVHADMLVPTETVYFRMNQSFMQATSDDSDRFWQSLIPGLGGRTSVDSPLPDIPEAVI